MTTQSTSYAKPDAGQLEVIFEASVTASVTGDAGFPMSGGADVILKCEVKDASSAVIGTGFVSRGSPSLHLTFSYPGSNAGWSAVASDSNHSFGGGLGSVSASVKVTFILIKR